MKNYDVIIIGGGPAGLVASKFLAAVGKKVALIEAHKLGGDCTHTGCIPSKSLLHLAKQVYATKQLYAEGILQENISYDDKKILSRVRQTIEAVYEHETPDKFEQFGIDVIQGKALFESAHLITVNDQVYKAKQFIIATGSTPFIPSLKGIEQVDVLTNENIFSLKQLPSSMIIVGTGVIAIEMATAFNRLGVKITIVSRSSTILKGNDSTLSQEVKKTLQQEGVVFIDHATLRKVSQKKQIKLRVEINQEIKVLKAQTIFFATGRVPNTQLNLEKANVIFDSKGIKVNAYLQTSQSHIYAIGDVSTPYAFTHIAEMEAIQACKNILFPLKQKINYEHIGWVIYTVEDFAHIGLTYEQAIKRYGKKVICQQFAYKNLDRGYTDHKQLGQIKVLLLPNGKILGAAILGNKAGELIHQLQMAKTFDIGFHKLSQMLYFYPTYSDLIKQSSKQFYLQKLQDNIWLKYLKKLMRYFKGAS